MNRVLHSSYGTKCVGFLHKNWSKKSYYCFSFHLFPMYILKIYIDGKSTQKTYKFIFVSRILFYCCDFINWQRIYLINTSSFTLFRKLVWFCSNKKKYEWIVYEELWYILLNSCWDKLTLVERIIKNISIYVFKIFHFHFCVIHAQHKVLNLN